MTITEAPADHRLTTSKAMVEAIALEMERDPSVIYLGEDVGTYGGIFGSTTGLLDKFGPSRILDTPISETGFIGLAIGAATEGMRPIVELMFSDFMGVCLDQIYNHMAKIHFESGGNVKVPMVLTMAVGGGYSDGAQHSQCLWGTFAHLPGMKVVVPSNPYDAKGLMTAAIRDDNPVVYMFHKGVMGLPWMAKNPRSIEDVPDGRLRDTDRQGVHRPFGCGRHRGHRFPLGPPHPGRRRGTGREGHRRRGARPAQPRPARPRGDPRLGRQDRPAGRRRRGLPVLRPVRRGRGHGRRRGPDPAHGAGRPGGVPDVPMPYAHSLEYAVLPRHDRIEAAIRRVVGA